MPHRIAYALSIALALGSSACRQNQIASPPGGASDQASPVAQGLPVSVLIDSLRRVELRIVDRPSGAWAVEGGTGILEAFRQHGDSAVGPLVACMGDTTSSRASYRDRPVMVGFVCFAALRTIVYAEVDDSGDWPGSLMPEAGFQGLFAAQSAWQRVVAEHAYRFN